MRIRFHNKALFDLYYAEKPPKGISMQALRGYQKAVQFLKNANSLQDIRAWKSLHFEKLQGDRQGQFSIKMDDVWRIILEIEKDENGNLILVLELTRHYKKIL